MRNRRLPSEESEFRYWAFQTYYHKAFALELDLDIRFAKAIIASAQPVRNPAIRAAWAAQMEQIKADKKRGEPLTERRESCQDQ